MINELEVDINPHTGSAFYRIASFNDLNLSLRLWKEVTIPTSKSTVFGFRIRVTLKEGVPTPIDLPKVVAKSAPKIKAWSGKSSKHASVTGNLIIKVEENKGMKVVDKIKSEKLFNKLWKIITRDFDNFTFAVTQDEFDILCEEIVMEEMGLTNEPEKEESTAVILSFAYHKTAYKDGVEVDVDGGK